MSTSIKKVNLDYKGLDVLREQEKSSLEREKNKGTIDSENKNLDIADYIFKAYDEMKENITNVIGSINNDIDKIENSKQHEIDALKEKFSWLNIDDNGNITYNFEDAINVSKNAKSIDMENFEQSLLENTDFKTLDEFNEYLVKTVDLAGYGTSDGVVAAAMYLAYIYPKLTGRTIEYSKWDKSTDEYRSGVTSDLKFDCRAFVWWCLYNGGFEWATDDNGNLLNHSFEFYDWANEKGMIRNSYDSAKPGDVVLTTDDVSNSHVLLVVGTYDGGYYTAEAQPNGLTVMERTYDNLEKGGYTIIDMDKYYSEHKLQ